LRREFEIAVLRRRDTEERDVVLAWNTAALSRQDKLPSLESLLAQRPQSRTERKTAAAQRTELALLSERLGIPMQPLSDEAKQALMRLRES
jgi:hypothetical protein